MCSMSLTVVVSARCDCVVMRPGHIRRLEARVLPDDRDHRDSDIRKDIDRRAQSRKRPDDQNGKRQHDERVRPSQRNANDSDHSRNAPKVTKSSRRAAILNYGRDAEVTRYCWRG